MDWNLYWTIVLQVGGACLLLFWPLCVLLHYVTHAVATGYLDAKRAAKAKKAYPAHD